MEAFCFGNVEKHTGRLEADGRYDDETRENLDEAGGSSFAQDAKTAGLGVTDADEAAAAGMEAPAVDPQWVNSAEQEPVAADGPDRGSAASAASLAGKVLRRGAGVYEDEDGEDYDEVDSDEHSGEHVHRFVEDYYARHRKPRTVRAVRAQPVRLSSRGPTAKAHDERDLVTSPTAQFGHLFRGSMVPPPRPLPETSAQPAHAVRSTDGVTMEDNSELSPPFLPVQSKTWEDDILWDDADGQPAPREQVASSPDCAAAAPARSQETKSCPAAVDWQLWGGIVSDVAESSDLGSDLEEFLGSDHTDAGQSEMRPRTGARRAIKAVINRSGGDACWIDGIVWDDDKPAAVRAGHGKLILDLNDKRMLFEDRTTRKTPSTDGFENFHAANELHYTGTRRRQSTSRSELPPVTHSVPALSLELNSTEPLRESDAMREIHHPRSKFEAGSHYRVASVNNNDGEVKGDRSSKNPELLTAGGDVNPYRHAKDLSARIADDRIVLCEYAREHRPVIVHSIGMATRLATFAHAREGDDEEDDEKEDPGRIPDGSTETLGPRDAPPFAPVAIPAGRRVSGLVNNLFSAPIAHHQPNFTDFLLMRTASSMELREIPAVYAVGHVLPKKQVPEPGSDRDKDITKRRVKAFLIRRLRDNDRLTVSYDEIKEAFPHQNDFSLRRLIKEVADEDKDDQGFRLKDQSSMISEAELRTLLSVDDVALQDCMLIANYRNADVNRIRATSRDGLKTTCAQQVEKALEYLHGAAMREVVDKVVVELKEAPWYRCTRVLTAQPSATRASRNGTRDRAWEHKKHDIPELLRSHGDMGLKQKYGSGTEAEVKKLTNPECRTILKLCGVPDTIANRHSLKQRWERILKLGSQADARPDAPQQFVQKKLQGPSVDLEQLQREFEAELVELVPEDTDGDGRHDPSSPGAEDEDDDMAEEARIMEDFLEGRASPRAATNADGQPRAAGLKDKTAGKGKRKIVKKRLEFMHPDGTRYRRYELIVDPKEVRDYVSTKKKEKARRAEAKKRHERRKEQLKSARAHRKHGRGKTKEQEADAKAAEIAERTRIINGYKEWVEGGRAGRHFIGKPGKDTAKPCSECGAYGHMKTNRICPLFEEDEFRAPKKAPRRSKPVQEAEGTKLTMSRREIQPSRLKATFSKRRIEEAQAATRDKNRKKQYSAIDDNEYDEKYRPRMKRQRAGRGTAYMRWCEAVEKHIIEELEREEHASVFMHPVSKKDAPTYHIKITKPICLRQIRENLRKHGYSEKNQFLADVQLMFDNCRTFNRGTASNYLADWADEMQQVFNNLMEKNAPELNALELQVSDWSLTTTHNVPVFAFAVVCFFCGAPYKRAWSTPVLCDCLEVSVVRIHLQVG